MGKSVYFGIYYIIRVYNRCNRPRDAYYLYLYHELALCVECVLQHSPTESLQHCCWCMIFALSSHDLCHLSRITCGSAWQSYLCHLANIVLFCSHVALQHSATVLSRGHQPSEDYHVATNHHLLLFFCPHIRSSYFLVISDTKVLYWPNCGVCEFTYTVVPAVPLLEWP